MSDLEQELKELRLKMQQLEERVRLDAVAERFLAGKFLRELLDQLAQFLPRGTVQSVEGITRAVAELAAFADMGAAHVASKMGG